MRPEILSPAVLAFVTVTGCTPLKPDAQLTEAADLVERNTGRRPAWTVPWDGQPPHWDGKTVLTLDEAIVMALRNNRDLRADLEIIGQADAELLQAGLLQNPTISLMVMFPDGGGRSMLRGQGLPMMPLQDLWLIPARKEVATAQLRQAVLRVADRAVETAASVKKTYAGLQYTQRAMELVRDNMAVVEQSTWIIRTRQTAGRATQVQVNLSQIRYMKLRSDLLALEAEHRSLQRELLMLRAYPSRPADWYVIQAQT
ncbi:MAG: TolC family protein, partial [Phycisphaerae bacterium]